MNAFFGGYNAGAFPYRDMAQFGFGLTDVVSAFWQPMLKGIGRFHLEAASLAASNTQAAFAYSRAASRAMTPVDHANAYREYIETLAANFNRSMPRVSGAISQATDTQTALEVITFPRLPDARPAHKVNPYDPSAESDYIRKVA